MGGDLQVDTQMLKSFEPSNITTIKEDKMPCTQHGSIENDRAENAKEQIDLLTRMLCETIREMEISAGPEFTKIVLRRAGERAPGLEEKTITRWLKRHRKHE
jgi:hypothetical protein